MNSIPVGLSLDLLGTFVFGLSGAMLAVRRQLDLFGIAVLAICSALAGGMGRDLMLGATPPAATGTSRPEQAHSHLVATLTGTSNSGLGSGEFGIELLLRILCPITL